MVDIVGMVEIVDIEMVIRKMKREINMKNMVASYGKRAKKALGWARGLEFRACSALKF